MFANTITLAGTAYNDVGVEFETGDFVLIPTREPNTTTRILTSSTTGVPVIMKIAHTVNGKGADAVDRHLISFSKSKVNGSGTVSAIANFTLAVPRSGNLFTEVELLGMFNQLADFLGYTSLESGGLEAGAAIVAQLLRGEA